MLLGAFITSKRLLDKEVGGNLSWVVLSSNLYLFLYNALKQTKSHKFLVLSGSTVVVLHSPLHTKGVLGYISDLDIVYF